MTLPPTERTGVLVIRAWVESNGADRLRARIRRTVGLERSEHTVSVVATPEEIIGIVVEWLDAFTGEGEVTKR